jgi:hypothetical protein
MIDIRDYEVVAMAENPTSEEARVGRVKLQNLQLFNELRKSALIEAFEEWKNKRYAVQVKR